MLTLFPMSLVLLPGARIPLTVSQQQYDDLFAGYVTNRVITVLTEQEDGEDMLADVGCLAHIEQVERLGDDEITFTLVGQVRCHLDDIVEKRGRLLVKSYHLLEDEVDLKLEDPVMSETQSLTNVYLDLLADVDPEMLKGTKFTHVKPRDSYKLADYLVLSEVERQEMLQTSSVRKRFSMAAAFLKREIATLKFLMTDPQNSVYITN